MDLVGDPDWPREKISQRLRQIRDERERLRRQLANTERPELDAEREAIEILLDLLTEPRQLYRLASRRARKVLNQAFFERLYVDSDTTRLYIANDQCTEPVKRLADLPYTQNETPALSGRGLTNEHNVEVRGIEPRSLAALPGLLRAQLAVPFSAPPITRASRCDGPSRDWSYRTGPATGPDWPAYLLMPATGP